MTKFPVVTELLLDGLWTNITDLDLVYTRDPISISRGRANESAQVEASRCTATFKNTDGRFSPRNPLSPYYGKIGRNTRIRASITKTIDTAPRFDASSFFSGTATGDFSWTHTPVGEPAGVLVFISQIVGVTDQVIGVTYGGVAMTEVTGSPLIVDAGTEEGVVYAYFLGENVPKGPQTVSVDVNATGSTKDAVAMSIIADSTTTVIEDTSTLNAASQANPSVALTTAVATFIAGVLLSGHDSLTSLTPTAPVTSLTFPTGDQDFGTQTAMYLYRTDEVPSGSPTIGVTATAEEAGLLAVAVKNGPNIARFNGEIPSWPQNWSENGSDVYVPIEAAGIMRRLGQGASPLRSAPRRAIEVSGPVAYWPLDDGKESTEAAPVVGDYPLKIRSIAPDVEFANTQPASWLESLPKFTNAEFQGKVEMPNFTNEWGIGSIVRPQDSTTTPVISAHHRDEPNAGRINHFLFLDTATTLRSGWTFAADDGGTTGADFDWTIPSNFFDGKPHWWELRVFQNGANIEHEVYVDGVLLTLFAGTGVISSRTLAAPYAAFIGGDGDDVLGHFAVWSSLTAMDGIADAALGYQGETAGNRMLRLSAEEGVAFSYSGDLDDTAVMGPQGINTFLNLMKDCAGTDLGILYEPRNFLGLSYRTRTNLYNQTPVLELNYLAGVFGSLPQPVDDDQLIRNDVTVRRPDGSFARAILLTGTLSIQDPPDGIGRYDTSEEANVISDGFLPNQAVWRLTLGTVDEPRYPNLNLELNAEAFTGDVDLTAAAVALDIGDRFTIENMPSWIPPDLISQLAQGFTELLGNNDWQITINASPESPWQVAAYESAEGGTYRYDTAGSSLAAQFVAGTGTSMSVNVDIKPLWTTDADEFPFDIECGGVRLRVTNISGGSSPQTFTIQQTPINGIAKTIPAGTSVSLWTKARYAL